MLPCRWQGVSAASSFGLAGCPTVFILILFLFLITFRKLVTDATNLRKGEGRLLGSDSDDSDSDDIVTNKRIVQSAWEALNAFDVGAFLDVLADDVKWTIIGSTRYSGTYNGKDDLLNNAFGPFLDEFLVPPVFVQIGPLTAERDRVALQAKSQGLTKSQEEYNQVYHYAITFAGGKIKDVIEYVDTALIVSLLG